MWTKARAVAALSDQIIYPFRVHVDFKLPVFLPANVLFNYKEKGNSIHFEVRDKNNVKPHLKGEMTFLK